MQQELTATEAKEYEGTGRFISTWGGWEAGGTVGALVGIVPAAVAFATGHEMIGAGVLAGSAVAGGAVGAYKGYNSAEDGEKQFAQMQQENMLQRVENQQLRAQLSHVERLAQRGIGPTQAAAPHASHAPQQHQPTTPMERVATPHEQHAHHIIAQQQQAEAAPMSR